MELIEQIKGIGENVNTVLKGQEEATKKAAELDQAVKEAKEIANAATEKAENAVKEINIIKADSAKIGSTQKVKSFDEQVYENVKESADQIKALKDNSKGQVLLDMKAAGTMLISGNYTGGTYGLTSWDPEFARPERRQPFLRQLVRVRPVSSMYVAWAEMTARDGAAGNTAEGAMKSQIDFDIVEATKKVEKITAFIKTSKESLQDIPYLQSEINTELVEAVGLKLDVDLLSGSGTTPVIKGILTYAPTMSVASTPFALGVDNANNFDVIRAAVAVVQASFFNPTAIVMHPMDAAMLDVYKATDNGYILAPFASANGQTIAGLRVVTNTGITQGTFLVGDFSKSTLGIREDITISIGYENDDFTKNLVTILAEMRAVHYIKANHVNAFVKGTFATVRAAMETA